MGKKAVIGVFCETPCILCCLHSSCDAVILKSSCRSGVERPNKASRSSRTIATAMRELSRAEKKKLNNFTLTPGLLFVHRSIVTVLLCPFSLSDQGRGDGVG